ncbi:hypothetical protein OVA29_17320 [Exiguobacterium sp. SL14]|nr:hypothetical protein [Exiguobacterium sp. SL14]MCY1692133.1 hypothetical protein [Exiguobacterium sp. SL14]
MSITLRSAELFDVPLVFRRPMQTAISTLTVRRTTILRLTDSEGRIGYGEGVAFDTPWYTSETQHSLQGIAQLLYELLEPPLHHPADVTDRFRIVQGNPMAKAMFEGAVYELFAVPPGNRLLRTSEVTSQPSFLVGKHSDGHQQNKRSKLSVKPLPPDMDGSS